MVLFKRKPVRILPPANVKDENAEVWHIPQTGEIFAQYDEYLDRMDFYKQRRFNCQITGHSGLTFFEALKSEHAGAEEVEQSFPEALKKPVLARVQFQVVSRIDTLVDKIFDHFKSDYYPGEVVVVKLGDGERLQGVVREKTSFPGRPQPDGTISQATTRYFVSIDDRDHSEAVDDSHIMRDRKAFTKAVLRSFIKQTVTREAWNGAPWLVKHDYATQYNIDTRIPPHLRYDSKLMERKLQQAQKRASQSFGPETMNGQPEPARLPELKPTHKAQKGKLQHAHVHAHGPHATQRPPHFPRDPKGSRAILGGPESGIFQAPPAGNPFQLPDFRSSQPTPQPVVVPQPPPPPPPPKYPIEDLDLEPREDKIRPPLRFMCKDPPSSSGNETNGHANGAEIADDLISHISMKSVGPLLETWDTLNVYCEIFKVDSFTFDDFVEAMHVTSEETPTQLFDEIHCSVLKILVSSEADGGKVNVPLPELEEDSEDEEEDEEMEEEETRSPTPEAEKPPARATRSSLAKAEAERLAAEAKAAEEEAVEPEVKHRAEDVLEDYEWIEHLRKRDFQDGGWHRIMVGLLHQLSKDEHQQEVCEDLLAQLVPLDVDPTQETVRQQYANLDIDHRVQALQVICMLTTRTKAMRAFMEDCNEQMTTYRKEKIEWQRQRKQAVEELRPLNDQRKALLPDNMPASPSQEAAKRDGETKSTDVDAPAEPSAGDASGSEVESTPRKNGRRLNDRAAERQRKRKEEQERKEKAAAEAARMPKQSKQFLKLLKDIQKKEELIKECEEEIAVIDSDLREADCPRTRVLGRDRFWNRYYWFERNGMPFGGLPSSSTAAADYANGCIWVQGPDELEREGYIDMKPEWEEEYRAKFGLTVPERKRREEGATSVHTAWQWGYYSEPEQVDDLLRWLDPRGINELKLRKEILAFKDKITAHMEKRKRYLGIPDKEKQDDREGAKGEDENGEEEARDKPATKKAKNKKRGVASRTRLKQTPEPEPTQHRCLAWQNTMALEELGHLHSEAPPPPPRSRKQTSKKRAATATPAASAPPEATPPPAKTRRKR